jgi:hypothetical protein
MQLTMIIIPFQAAVCSEELLKMQTLKATFKRENAAC